MVKFVRAKNTLFKIGTQEIQFLSGHLYKILRENNDNSIYVIDETQQKHLLNKDFLNNNFILIDDEKQTYAERRNYIREKLYSIRSNAFAQHREEFVEEIESIINQFDDREGGLLPVEINRLNHIADELGI